MEHSYYIQGPDTGQDWSLEDTLSMLSVVEQCGYGSWEEVARIMPGKRRGAQDIKQHYDTVFVHGDTQLPLIQASSFSAVNKLETQPSHVQYFPLSSNGEDPPRPGIRQGSAINNLKHSGGWYNKLAGYIPARAEFSQEWDNQGEIRSGSIIQYFLFFAAESCLSMECCEREEDSSLEEELKLGLVSIYNQKLSERVKVKKLMKEHSLIHKAKVGKGQARLRTQLSGSSWTLEQISKLSQLLCAIDLDFLLEGILHELELRTRVLRLQEVRRAGVRMLASVELMETLLARRREQMEVLGSERVQDMVGRRGLTKRNGGTSSKRVTLPLDIVGLPGCEKLGVEERELCSLVRILPNVFTEIKEVLIEECEKSDGMRLAEARNAVKIDVNKTRRIYDFLIQQGNIWAPKKQVQVAL